MPSRLDTSVSVSKDALSIAQHLAKIKTKAIRTLIDDLIYAAFDNLDEKQKLLITQARENERAFQTAVAAELERQDVSTGGYDPEYQKLLDHLDLELSDIKIDFDIGEIDDIVLQ